MTDAHHDDDEQTEALVGHLRRVLTYQPPTPLGLVARLQAHVSLRSPRRDHSTISARIIVGAMVFSALAFGQSVGRIVAALIVTALLVSVIDLDEQVEQIAM